VNRLSFAARNILDKLTKCLSGRGTFVFYLETYVLSRLNYIEPDIYVVSYPKCGRTWLRVLLRQYLDLANTPVRHYKDRQLIRIGDALTVKFEHDQGSWIPAPPRLDRLVFNSAKYRNKRVLFLARDPRDALVSSWYHLTHRERIITAPLSEFIREDLVGIRKITAFMNMWLENKHIPEDFLLLTYEDMHADPVTTFHKALAFMGLEVDQVHLEQAVDESRFEKMQRMEKQGVLKEPWMKPGGYSDAALKVRKGQVGSYRDELSDRDIVYIDQYLSQHLNRELPYHPSARDISKE
jgi:hypothetical protein